jgi:hypothetical protein
MMIKTVRRKSTDYVSNAKMFEAIMEYQKQCNSARELQIDIPRVPKYIGECFIEIATRYASKPNFYGYSYRDEMIADAIEACLKAIHGFKSERSQNPFAFFTTTVYYAFLQRIAAEKKQHAVKIKNMINTLTFDERLHPVEDLVDVNLYHFIDAFDKSLIPKVKGSLVIEGNMTLLQSVEVGALPTGSTI